MHRFTSLHHRITSSPCPRKVLELVPSPAEDIVYHEEGDELAIGVPKKTYVEMFVAAHHQWHEFGDWRHYIAHCTEDQLVQFHLVTLALMLTTHENHTVLVAHEAAVTQLHVPWTEEFEFVTTLVSSKLPRINKSSSLWHWVKKVAGHFGPDLPEYTTLIRRTLVSMRHHPSNYYASAYLKHLIRINWALGPDRVDELLLTELLALGHQNLTDVSVWSSIQTCLRVQSNSDDTEAERYAREYVKNASAWHASQQKVPHGFDRLRARERTWLKEVGCQAQTPFRCLD